MFPLYNDYNKTIIFWSFKCGCTYIRDIYYNLHLNLNYKKNTIKIITLLNRYNKLDYVKSRIFTAKIQDLADKNAIIFANYSEDKNFHPVDFTVMPDHLNHDGAIKFSETLNRDYLINMCAK